MMNIEKIIIANNGMEIRITEMNNRQVVRDGIYRMAECVNLIDNDYTIDYKTIAGLLCMTEEEFKRNYKLGRTESEREYRVCGADWILTYAEFTMKDEFDILLDAIQNGDIDITDDEPEEDEEYENNNVEVDDMWSENCECFAYDRARGYYLEKLVRNNNGEIAFIDYISYDDSERITLTKDDLYIDGVELLDYYEDNDYGFKTALRAIIERKRYEEEPEETIIEVPKEEPVMVPHNNMVIAKIQEQMIKALEECDFETYDKLEERLNRLNK